MRITHWIMKEASIHQLKIIPSSNNNCTDLSIENIMLSQCCLAQLIDLGDINILQWLSDNKLLEVTG